MEACIRAKYWLPKKARQMEKLGKVMEYKNGSMELCMKGTGITTKLKEKEHSGMQKEIYT